MKTEHAKQTLYLVELALMIAVIIIMAFTPLGYLKTLGIEITFLTVPVAVGAIMLGPKGGAICGLAFGVTSFIQAFTTSAFGAMLLSINPAASMITCIVPRVLEGFLCGVVYRIVRKFAKNGAFFAAGLACPLFNTVLFMTFLMVFFYHTDYMQSLAESLGVVNPILFVAAFVGAQGLVEAAVCCIIAGAVSRALSTALKQD